MEEQLEEMEDDLDTGTFAELLIETVESLKGDKDALIIPEEHGIAGMSTFEVETFCARVAMSVVFTKRSKGFQLRAIMEEWDILRTTREMY